MFERFTTAARAAVTGAQAQARLLEHDHIGTEHVLIAMLEATDSPVARALRAAGVDAETVRTEVRERVGSHHPDLSFTDADAEDAAALKAIGIDLAAVRAAIEQNFGAGALHLPRPAKKKRGLFGRAFAAGGHIPFSPRAKKVLELSLREALRLGNNFIAPEHIMLGIIRENGGLAMEILADRQVDLDRLRSDLATTLKGRAA
jgi:ATP-dependent Clp protease ATP-binding subunit ClpA